MADNIIKIEATKNIVGNIFGVPNSLNALTYTNPDPLINNIGGIKASEHENGFNKVSVSDLLTELLYPYTEPVINSFRLTPAAGVKEKGVKITLEKVIANITKKSKKISKVELYKGSTLLASYTGEITSTGTTVTFSDINDNLDGSTNTTYTIKVSEENGTSDVVTQNATYTFVNPYYYGIVNKSAEINEDLVTGLIKVIESKGKKERSYTTTKDESSVIAYPASYGELTNIKDQNGFTQTWTKYDVTIGGVAYYVYVSGPAAATNFKYTFTY